MSWPNKIRDRPTGWTHIWKFWRHCCCRYGYWPLLVACVVTAACLLDIYSSFNCEFLKVNIGFNPANTGWNQSTANIGFFFYEETGDRVSDQFGENLAPGCQRYSDAFESQFINGDRTWQVSRVMAMIAALSGMISAVTAWLLVITPVPPCFVWPGIMLPGVMLAFLAEGSKFLFFDVSVCHAALWYPSGTESAPRVATSCDMGRTSYFVIAACIIFFISLVMICLKAPEKRTLKEDYGEETFGANYMMGAQAVNSGSLADDPESQIPAADLDLMDPDATFNEDLTTLPAANTSMVMSMSLEEDDSTFGASKPQDPPSYPGSDSFQAELAEDFQSGRLPITRMVSEEDGGEENLFASSKDLHALAMKVGDGSEEELNNLADKVAANSPGAALVANSDSEGLIDKCVTQLAQSFREDDIVVVEKSPPASKKSPDTE